MKFYRGMTCLVCETGSLELQKEDIEFEYKGKKTIIHNQEVFKCPECDESFLNPKDERMIEKFLTDERRKVDGLLTSDEIRMIRQQFNMTQTEFASVLRVAEKTFARYESGQTAQSYAMDNLLRILWKCPETLEIIRHPSSEVQIKRIEKKMSTLPYITATQELFHIGGMWGECGNIAPSFESPTNTQSSWRNVAQSA